MKPSDMGPHVVRQCANAVRTSASAGSLGLVRCFRTLSVRCVRPLPPHFSLPFSLPSKKNTQRQQRHATHTALAELAFPIAEEATRLFNATLNSVRGACERGGARSNQVFERRWSWFCIRAVMGRSCCATKLHGDRRRPPTRAAQRHKWPDDSLRRLEERGGAGTRPSMSPFPTGQGHYQMPVKFILLQTFWDRRMRRVFRRKCIWRSRLPRPCAEALSPHRIQQRIVSLSSPFITVDWRLAQRNKHLNASSGIVPTSRRRKGYENCKLAFD